MKKHLKTIIFFVVALSSIYAGENLYKQYTIKKQVEESNIRKAKAEEEYKKLEDAFNKIQKSLDEQSEFMENLCFSFWQENKIPSDDAVSLCKCETEVYNTTFPVGDIWFIMDNVNRFDFLLYKKDKRAMEIMDKIKAIRKDCINKEMAKLKK